MLVIIDLPLDSLYLIFELLVASVVEDLVLEDAAVVIELFNHIGPVLLV